MAQNVDHRRKRPSSPNIITLPYEKNEQRGQIVGSLDITFQMETRSIKECVWDVKVSKLVAVYIELFYNLGQFQNRAMNSITSQRYAVTDLLLEFNSSNKIIWCPFDKEMVCIVSGFWKSMEIK